MADDAPSPTSPAEQVALLTRLLDVEELDIDLFRGGVGRVFGGQVIAQALQAAQRSTEGKVAHSLHAYFMRAGDEQYPVLYRVVRDFDGKSFANRRVIATQRGVPILNMAASFQVEEDGLHHQAAMPDVPPPESLKTPMPNCARRRSIAFRNGCAKCSCAASARSRSARSTRAAGMAT